MILNSSVPKLGYQPALDGIRSVAVMLVVLSHANFQLGKNGGIGVSIFFTLSGFLITTLLLEEYQNRNQISLKAFYTRRTMRLFPALYLLLFFVSLFALIFKSGIIRASYFNDIFYSFFYIYNIAKAEGWVEETNVLYHMWSLGIEEQFYLIWPIILILFIRFRLLKSLLYILPLLIGFIWVTKQTQWLHHLPAAVINESILIGCAGALFRWCNVTIIKKVPNWLSFILFFTLILFGAGPLKHLDSYHLVSNTCSLFVVVILLNIVLNENTILTKLLSFSPFVFVGKISYSLYLWHLPVFRIFAEYSTFPSYISFALKFIISFILAYLSWVLIEKRTTMLGRKWSNAFLQK